MGCESCQLPWELHSDGFEGPVGEEEQRSAPRAHPTWGSYRKPSVHKARIQKGYSLRGNGIPK